MSHRSGVLLQGFMERKSSSMLKKVGVEAGERGRE